MTMLRCDFESALRLLLIDPPDLGQVLRVNPFWSSGMCRAHHDVFQIDFSSEAALEQGGD